MSRAPLVMVEAVTADQVKELHYQLIGRGDEYAPGLGRGVLRRRVRRIREGDIRKVMRALPPFLPSEARQAWSHRMALLAGRHLFPDANHRTAFTTFHWATLRVWGLIYTLPPGLARTMVSESKAVRDADYVRRNRFYSPAELANADHPYRQVFARYERRLTLWDIDAIAEAVGAGFKGLLERLFPRRPPSTRP